IDDAGNKAENSNGKFEKLGSVLKGIGATMGAVAVAAGAAAVALASKVVSAYAEFEQLEGGVKTLFGTEASSVEEYAASVGKSVGEVEGKYNSLLAAQKQVFNDANNAYKTAGLSANEYMSTVTSFSASLISSLNGDTEAAAKASNQAIIDMSDNANKMGTDMSLIQSAYQGFAKQNYTMLDNLKLGYGGTKTEMERLLKDAEKISGVKYDISNLNDVYSAIHVIQTEMGITGTTAAEAEKTIQGSANAMKAAFENLITGFGNADADMKLLVQNLADSLNTVIKNVTPVLNNIVSVLPTVLDSLLGAIGQMLPTLLEAVTELFSSLLETILNLIPELVPTVVTALTTIIETLVENLPLLMDAIVVIFTSLIEGIGELLPTLIPTAVEAIITIVNGLIENLPMLLNAALQLIMGLAQGLFTALPVLI
ncbi:phage tail protein, partial [Ruminococcus sp.]|uniref:phage tail protein n=1 Tax=Ruminococcus sp. TaxID=41978 RepID=UPI002E852E16|nr:phage tail protein [Ruminococcus sp.]